MQVGFLCLSTNHTPMDSYEKEKRERKKNNRLKAIRIEPAEGGYVVQKERSDWEDRPDPAVFSDVMDMMDYIEDFFKSRPKKGNDYAGKVRESATADIEDED